MTPYLDTHTAIIGMSGIKGSAPDILSSDENDPVVSYASQFQHVACCSFETWEKIIRRVRQLNQTRIAGPKYSQSVHCGQDAVLVDAVRRGPRDADVAILGRRISVNFQWSVAHD